LLKSGTFFVSVWKELVASFFDADVESARIGRAAIELGGRARRSVREVFAREAIVGEEWCGQLEGDG
jgi:hypothetical protein